MRRARGYSLAEVLVAAAVSALMMTALYQLLASGARMYVRGMARGELQSAGLMALSGLSRELQRSAFALLTIRADGSDAPPALAFRMQDALDAVVAFTPAPVYVVYYHDVAGGRLVRKTWGNVPAEPVTLSPSPLLVTRRLTADELRAICATPNGTERMVADRVSQWTVSPQRYPAVVPVGTVSLSLVLTKEIASDRVVTETVSCTVALRNHP